MSLQGKIISLHDNGHKAKVLVKPVSDCKGCQACAGLIKMSKAANTDCEVDVLTKDFDVHEGDIVKIELSEYQGSKVAFIIYGIPIIGFLAGMFSAPLICNTLGIEISDLVRVISAFSGLFISFAAIVIYLKHKKSDNFVMSITQKLPNN